eukprot:TRINITY_DN15010_c0_g1_i1.p1 TRINITY_DN15010_c0_g1~~TRINITY_DN15010_c0_g1_i1.p1  ORF type:complete len:155 (+),score=23.00 TRINITY_DN15010_c0_g1_i1:84-548(+)
MCIRDSWYQGPQHHTFPRSLLEVPRSALESYPSTLLVVAMSDQLRHSSYKAHKCLETAGVSSELVEYPGQHGFLGIPCQWSWGSWKRNSAPAMERIVSFLRSKEVQYPRTDQRADWSIWLMVLIHVIVAVLLSTAANEFLLSECSSDAYFQCVN